jgi:aminoglycoside phosphotransferase (APT) family kinase protein
MEGHEPSAQERLGQITGRLGEVLGERVSGLRRLSSGASRETFSFSSEGLGELIVQIARGRSKITLTPPEAPLLQAAAQAGVPVPRVLEHGQHDEVLGVSWAIVEALRGTTDPGAILAGDGVPEAEELLDGIARALVAVHRMPADEALAPAVEDPLALIREWHERLGEPHPTFELAFRALESDRPAPGPRTLVHGDFRMGNLMVAAGGLSGVLDWELAHIGDPVEDLGWLCVPAWRFTRPERPACGLASREALLAAYARNGGIAVDPARLRWWELAGTLRWGVICVMQAFTHLSGAVQSIEHAVIGRRACEVEWDLLELLDPSPGAADAHAPAALAPESPHDRPTAAELLEASRGALGDDVLVQLDGRAAFQTRVTMRALGIVRRELELAPEHAALHSRVLAALEVGSEAELGEAIREGRFDGRRRELFAALRASVRAKLEVANPRYLRATAKEQQ